MSRWSRSEAILACAAALSICFRPVTAGRCGWSSTAIDWNRSGSSTRPISAPRRPQEEMHSFADERVFAKARRHRRVVRKLDQRALELEVDRRESQACSNRSGKEYPFPEWNFWFLTFVLAGVDFLPICRTTLIWLDGGDRVEAEAKDLASWLGSATEKAIEEHHLVPPVETLYLNEHEWREALAAVSQVRGEALTILATSEKAQETTLTVESFLTSDIAPGPGAAWQGCFVGAAGGTAQRLGKGKGCSSSHRRRAMPCACGSCWAATT